MDTKSWFANRTGCNLRNPYYGFRKHIIVPGNDWNLASALQSTSTGTNTNSNAVGFSGLTATYYNLFIEAHEFLVSYGGGKGLECVSATVGSDRLGQLTTWALSKKLKAFLGAMGAPITTLCVNDLGNALRHIESNADVWQGYTYWAAIPLWPQAEVNEI
ncbi:hypothetical protein BJ742DRAFT_752365 [Cladochytrium replicatum]|nr:hypothetical protein BJ742DRAFT_752365 [Cladochytrium replicatum]